MQKVWVTNGVFVYFLVSIFQMFIDFHLLLYLSNLFTALSATLELLCDRRQLPELNLVPIL